MSSKSNFKIGNIVSLEDFTTVSIPTEVLGRLYQQIKVVTDEVNFYFLNSKNLVVYQGSIDKEGLYATIVKDITTIPNFINLTIARNTTDLVNLLQWALDDTFVAQLSVEMKLASTYLKENKKLSPAEIEELNDLTYLIDNIYSNILTPIEKMGNSIYIN